MLKINLFNYFWLKNYYRSTIGVLKIPTVIVVFEIPIVIVSVIPVIWVVNLYSGQTGILFSGKIYLLYKDFHFILFFILCFTPREPCLTQVRNSWIKTQSWNSHKVGMISCYSSHRGWTLITYLQAESWEGYWSFKQMDGLNLEGDTG